MFLGIDCSGVMAEMVLVAADGREFFVREDTPRQADVIFPMLEKILAEAKITMREISAIGAITGPGSFTGIRVGLAFAQGIADGLGIPAHGLSAFDALRRETGDGREGIIVLESKRAELYMQHDGGTAMMIAEQILQLAGKDKKIIHNLGENSPFPPLPSPFLSAAAARHAKNLFNQNTPGEILAPYYLREADAKPQINAA